MFAHAASYFGDPEAQYQLASLYLDGTGVKQDAKRAVPWLVLAANKGHYKAQALLGRILFNGEHGTRQRATGLMWLTVACDGPGAKLPWVEQLRETAVQQATDDERAMALILLPAAGSKAAENKFQAASISRSTYTGTWSDGCSQERTCLSMPAVVSRSAACGDSSRWSMRMPQFFCQAPAW